LLMRHGGVVSGSVALRYFLPRTLWEPNDIDIYVPESHFEDFVRAATDPRQLNFTLFPHHRPWQTLDSRESTASVDASDDSFKPSTHVGIREVRQFYTTTDRRVDVISVPSNNPVVALKHFWSSLVTNFLRPNMASCGFPLTTLDGVGVLK
ncbi:hypothetical protein C8T65DRAFT_520797, partial [Cerioporus squamosus]